MPTPTQPLNSEQVAELLGVNRATVNRRAAAGELPATKLPGRTGAYLFDRADIEQLANNQTALAEGGEVA